MSVIDDERLTLARIAELWSRECGVSEDTIRRGLAIIAHDGGFEFLIPSELVEYSEDAFFDPDLRQWHQSGLVDGTGARISSMQLRCDYVMGLAGLLGGSRPKRNAQRRRPTDLSALYTTILHPNGLGFDIALLDRAICALGLTSGELLSRYHSACNEEPQIIQEFQEKFYDDLAKRISVNRDALLHWVRLQRPNPSPGEAVELPDPSFWGDVGSDRPVDWLRGIPGHEDNRAGLTLGEALKRYSDPLEWAEYEARVAPDRPSDEQGARGIDAALVTKFERHLYAGRLVALAYVKPITLDAQPRLIPPDKLPLARFDYEYSTASVGDMELVGIRVYPAGAETGPAPDPYRTGLPGRPPKLKHLIEREFKRRAAAGEVLPTLAAEAGALCAWAAREHPTAPTPTIKTIRNYLAPAYRRHTQDPARN